MDWLRILYRYFRRRGLRWAVWGARLGVIAWGVMAVDFMLRVSPNGWSIVAVIAIYAVWVFQNHKPASPVSIVQIRASRLAVTDGTFRLDSSDLDSAVERLIEREKLKVEA